MTRHPTMLQDARGIVHAIDPFYEHYVLARAWCSTPNQNMTGNGLVHGIPLPVEWPTCVFCVAYEALSTWRRRS